MLKFVLCSVFFLIACSNSRQLLNSPGVRQTVYRKQTDLLLTELHFPITNNTTLDDLLRERILAKYQAFRSELNNNTSDYLNLGTTMIYRVTFDALRSPDLQIISFVFYESQEQTSNAEVDKNIENIENISDAENISQREANGQNSKTQVEVFMYSLKYSNSVDFLDVVQDPLTVFERLAESCLRQLNEYIGPGNFYSQGIQPDREHLNMLSFGKSGIQVSFPPGQIMRPDQGVINVLVPWEEALSYRPWQNGIIRSYRPLRYRRNQAIQPSIEPER